MYWRLNRIIYPVRNLGPGKRIGIWVQGCSIKCDGCISRSLWDIKNGVEVDILTFINNILILKNEFDGITISGGEPFDQYLPLIVFTSLIKKKSSLNILCYSGYKMHEIEKMYPDKRFLKTLDYLIDGKFDKGMVSSDCIRGSVNQNIYEIRNGKYKIIRTLNNSKKWSIEVTKNKNIFLSGVPAKNDIKKLEKKLFDKGLEIKFK
jgi:anaerobic ribonucleoside-triphosphate reductase activating protein